MSITRLPIPKKARNREAVPWRFTTYAILDADQVRAIAAVLLDDTKYHALIQAYGGFGTTVFEGDYWGSKGRGKDLSQVARRWEEVESKFPDFILDGTLEYRVTNDLADDPMETFEVTEVNPDLGLPSE